MATITKGIKLSELSSMSSGEKQRRINELFDTALNPTYEQLQEQKKELNFKICFFEEQYKMSSGTMKQKLSSGQLNETVDICKWLMLLKIRGHFETKCQSSQT